MSGNFIISLKVIKTKHQMLWNASCYISLNFFHIETCANNYGYLHSEATFWG